MEVEESSDQASTNSSNDNSLNYERQIWVVMNNTFLTIFPTLDYENSEDSLHQLLESLLCRFNNLNILVPPLTNNPIPKDVQRRYTAFTTWLFGAMFYLISVPVSSASLQKIIDIQVCMVRILSRLNREMHENITSEYLSILDELVSFDKQIKQIKEIKLNKFQADQNAADYLNLTPYTVTVKYDDISLFLTSVLKVIAESDVSVWPKDRLKSQLLEILVFSEPRVKLAALKICIEMIDYRLLNNIDMQSLILYATEIVKSLSIWDERGLIPRSICQVHTATFKQLVKLINDPAHANFYFEIISALQNHILSSEKLEYETCKKIENNLIKVQKSYKEDEIKQFLSYFENCQYFMKVIVCFILQEIRNNNVSADINQVSKLWITIKDQFYKYLQLEQYKNLLLILRLTNLLDLQLAESNISINLFEHDIANIQSQLLKALTTNNCEQNKLIFENFCQLISLRGIDNNEIQNILLLPWLDSNALTTNITKTHLANAKSLDCATKVKCLIAICRHGKGYQRLHIINMCISSSEIELGVAIVGITYKNVACFRNSPVLLLDKSIKFNDIVEKILVPAYNTQKPLLHEALATVMGQLACLISENGTIIRDPNDFEKWMVNCEYCHNLQNHTVNTPKVVAAKFEIYFNSFFELLNSNSKKVRLNLSKNLIRLSNHINNFNSNATAKMWISYVKDNDEEIRKNFADAIGHILTNRINSSIPNKPLQDNTSEELLEFIKTVMDNLVAVLNDTFNTSNQSMHQTFIQSHLTERRCLNIFLLTVLHAKSSPLAVALATDAYKEVTMYHKVPLKTMYIRYKKDFLKLMMTLAVHNRINYDYNMATTVHRVAKCIGFQGSRQLLRKDGHHALCFLLPQIVKSRKAITLFHDIAELINADEKVMFKSYFEHICCRVLLFESTEDGIQIFKLVSEITKSSIPVLIADSFSLIISEIMLHFHSQKEKVLNHLQFLSKYDDQQSASFKSQSEIAQYLNSMLHGILVTFDANLGPNSEETMQKYALASLAEVMNFMGPNYITQYKYKILATLRTALTFTRPGFRNLACNAWSAFIRNTSVRELGPLLATICMSLVSLLEFYPKETNAMLEYLIIKNRELVKEHISDLFFIKDLKVSPNISTRIINHINQTKPKTVEENLKLWIKRIVHQTDEVRLKALLYLQQFLAKHRNDINDLILSDSTVHPLIVELLDTLMAGCQDKDEAICIASGECIGELGAIEPSLLPRRIISRTDTKFICDMNEEFADGLFRELVKDFQSQKNTQSLDCFSLAIQEILRSYEISPGGRNCRLWNDLSSKIQHMIYPLLTSHYTITTASEVELPSPIYGSESGSTFETWAFNWTVSMLKIIKDSNINNVLNACRPAFKRSIRIMTFCIPYIVAYVVSNGSHSDVRKLCTEMLAVVATNEKSHVDRELSRNRPLRVQIDTASNNNRVSDEARRVRCLQVIFSTLDHLQRWLRERRRMRDSQYERIEKFCDCFPKLALAQGCYQSYEYHRALIYLEQHMTSSKKGLSESLEGGLLAKIYTQLEEPDGVSGILVSQDKCPDLQQLVLAHEVSGQFQDAATCYERLLQNTAPKPKYLQGMIQCYLGLDQPFTAMSITNGILKDRPELETLICDSEPFWQLAHFGKLGNDIKNNVKSNLLQDLKNNVKPDMFAIKKKLVSLLTVSSRPGAYEQSYSYIMKLHIVNEFEKACTIMLEDLENLPKIFEEWEKRDKLVNASRGAEFVLGMRRAILDLAVQLQSNVNAQNTIITEEIGKLWLKSAKIARKAGLYQQAYMYILSATGTCPQQDLCIEQAQLYWQKGSPEEALITLRRCLTTFFKNSTDYKKQPPGIFTTERKQCAKTKLLWAKYNDETLNVDANGNMINYKEAYEVWKNWEKSCLAIARYYESVIDKMSDDERMSVSGRDMQAHVINYYGKSLLYGCKYIHQSLPRMLTVWLDYASRARAHNVGSDNGIAKTLGQMTKIIEAYIERVPIFMWLTAFSQLASRICHPNREVQNTLFTIIVKLIKAYPQHCLWMMASVFNSGYSTRQKCCKEILNREALKTTEMAKLISCFHKFWERLIELSNKHIPDGVQTTTVNVLSRSLPKLLADKSFGPIMMPTTKFRQLHLPMKGASMEQHNPFATKIQNHVEDVFIFSVVPLNEECGLIEWVPNLIGYRNVLMNLYKERNILTSQKEIRTMTCALKDPLEKKRQVFTEKLVPRHPPVLGDWFHLAFPDPYGWYEARTAYIRTTAVMSMVGYILGLGDRHGENILLDSKCGDCVHVDFNCLFNRGETFEWPERVPFRLTHNMVEAMGPLKYEGPFRQSCRTTMKVLREQASTLISVLKPFVYDPLVTWSRNQISDVAEKTNEKAVEHIKSIEERLKGMVGNRGKRLEALNLYLSVEGQVNHLILDAINVDNLCQMYIGWGPYL
ncbi:hypothetical protein TSAR_005154 [Trichomalopsis sarcophagae]|uniref:Serine/threonine-protein kinase ATR n=1 Tax=Trichomalopsis sarcophagae TaxID=543379 RepID=A0A232FE18_9HYME|nr:hypothetical protein TSAR_005154 [Trichomalopsis sarcophagae]